MKAKRLHVAGDFPEFVVTNKSGTPYNVKLDALGNGTCTCPDFHVRIAQEGRICKHIAAAALTSLAPQVHSPAARPGNGQARANGTNGAEGSPLIFRFRRIIQTDGKNGLHVEVQGRLTDDEARDEQTVSTAYQLLDKLISVAGQNGSQPPSPAAAGSFSRSTAKATSIKSRAGFASKDQASPAVISKIDRMKTRQGESLFLKVDVDGETVRVFGSPEELAERLEASGYDIPASEIQAGMELNLPCQVVTGQGGNGYKKIERFLPDTA